MAPVSDYGSDWTYLGPKWPAGTYNIRVTGHEGTVSVNAVKGQ